MPRRSGRSIGALALALAVGASCAGGRGTRAATSSTSGGSESSRSTASASTSSTAAPSPARAPALPTAPDGKTFTVPSSMPHDCSTDVAGALQAWMNAVPADSVIAFPKRACYQIDETVTLVNRHQLMLSGNGATLRQRTVGDRTRQALVFEGGRNVIVRDLIVRGANPRAGATKAAYDPKLEAQHAFEVNGAEKVLLDHVEAFDVYGDFVYIGAGPQGPSRNVTVRDSVFARSGRQGISVTDAVGVAIEHNDISGVARSVFDVEPDSARGTARDISIVANTTGSAVNFWLADKGAAANVGDIVISDNRMTAATGGLVFVYAPAPPLRGPFTIDHNHFIANDAVNDEGSKGAFFFTRASNITITANDVMFPPGHAMPAVELRASRHVRVHDNTFEDAGPTFLAGDGSSDFTSS